MLVLGSGSGSAVVNCGASYGSWRGEANVAACVHVAAGTYAGPSIVTTKVGTSTQKIVFISDTKWGAKLQSNASGFCCVWVAHGTYVQVVGSI
jgi:hypothetical protein